MGVCTSTITVAIPKQRLRTKSAIPRRTSATTTSPCSSPPSTSLGVTARMNMTIKSWCVGRSPTTCWRLTTPKKCQPSQGSLLRALKPGFVSRSSRSSTGEYRRRAGFPVRWSLGPLYSGPSELPADENRYFYGANVDIGPSGRHGAAMRTTSIKW